VTHERSEAPDLLTRISPAPEVDEEAGLGFNAGGNLASWAEPGPWACRIIARTSEVVHMKQTQAGLRAFVLLAVLTPLCGLSAGGCASARSTPTGVANVHTVAPGVLVRGGQPDAAGFRALKQAYGIGTVVNLNHETAASEAKIVEALGMRYVALPSNAFRPDAAKVLMFLQAVAAASAESGAVYVHCRHGMDRTGFAVAAYRILTEGWDADRAMAELRKHQAFPHALLFPAIEPFVRRVYRDRETWLRQLAPTGAPPAPTTPPTAVATSDAKPS
jgi:protein tyrosine phosphatase (PTP) superfamily phosphohydrolase (DUF442 family)